MEVISAVIAKECDILVRELFGGSEIGSIDSLTETGEEPGEIRRRDILAERHAQSFSQDLFG